MGKSHAQHEREYWECLKEKNPEMQLKQDRDRKRIQREALEKTTNFRTTKQKIEWEKENKKSQ